MLRALALFGVILLLLSAQAASATAPSDDFNRPNGSLGSNWVAVSDGALSISSQAVLGTSATAGAIRIAETYTSDQSSQIQLTSTQLSGGQWVGPTVRSQSGGQNTYLGIYFWNNGSQQLRLYKRNAGTWIQLGNSYNSGPLAAGTTLQLSAVGSTISFLQDGATRITATDTSVTGGAPGVMTYGAAKADNWAGAGATGSSSPTYSVGGTISGLSGTVVLRDNGGDDLTVSANGPFSFATKLASGAAYNVTVKTNPSGQSCSVANGSGTIAAADVTNVAVSCAASPTYSVGGTISGLSGTVVLRDNGGDDLTVSANGPFSFATKLASGAAYNVTVKTNPSGQSCSVANGSGTIAAADVTNVAVSCAASPTYSVGGTISGLSGTVVLRDNGGDDLTVSANGPFSFATKLASGAAYNVTVKTNPSGQSCSVANGSGTIAAADVTNVAVSCAATGSAGSDDFNRPNGSLGSNWVAVSDGALSISSQAVLGTSATAGAIRIAETYTSDQSSQIQLTSTQLSGGQWVGPTVRSQSGGQNTYLGIYFWNNGSQQLRLYKRNAGTWIQLGNSYNSGPLAAGTTLQLSAVGSTISFLQDGVTRITATDTSVTGGAPGVMTYGAAKADNWAGAGATGSSSPTYSVGGTISGLSGTVVLRDNGGDDLTVSANGPFSFATKLASGAAYNVTVKTNPSGQSCSVANGSGTIAAADVTNVAVSCAASPTYSVGGTISGLSGTVVLRDNGGDDLTVSANGPFSFATKLASGAAYNVTVKTNPSGQSCSVANGSGTIAAADVTNVAVSCAATGSAGSDDFNRPNGSLGSNWVAVSDGALSISSQAVLGTSATAGAIRIAETYTSDQSSQIQLTSTQLSGGQWVGPTVRSQSGGQNTYLGIYFWNNGSQQLRLYKRNAGTWIQLGNSYNSGPLAAGTTLQLSAVGSTISFLQDGVSRITATDTSVTGGAPGVMTYGAAKADNWAGAGATGSSSPTYSVGGTISGLSGTVVLRDNGGDDLTVSANGPFNFATKLASGAAYAVTVKTNPSGQSCSVANGSGTIGSADVTNVAVTCGTGNNGFSATYRSTDANGVASYDVTSTDNGYGTQTLRVLAPTHPAAGVPHSFLYVLPVEAGLGSVYGDGMTTLEALDAQNQYNLTIVEPSFEIEPWYADNPNDSNLRYETFMTNDLVPWVTQNLSTTGQEQKWLIGFSKSGIGGQDLLLKHPDVFTLAASWDFPADMSNYGQYGASPQYGTDANFQANYRLTPIFLEGHKLPFVTSNRIWIGGYDVFRTDMSDYEALLNSVGILHATETPTPMPHRWDSGWVQIALAALRQESQNLATSP